MKILLIEDDEALVNALKMSLTREGYTVDAVSDGQAAKKRVEIHRDTYDLIILDLSLPNVSGFDIYRSARANNVSVPILILTGDSDVEHKVEVLNLGADDYMTKPFSIRELIARVRALFRRPRPVISNVMAAGDIRLDVTKRLVVRGTKEVQLSLKEFGILEYLMSRPNQVVQRDEILDHVWDFNYTALGNVVDVHINRIRSKLSMTKDKPLETVRGIGYRLSV